MHGLQNHLILLHSDEFSPFLIDSVDLLPFKVSMPRFHHGRGGKERILSMICWWYDLLWGKGVDDLEGR
jgi:hypothetical protein